MFTNHYGGVERYHSVVVSFKLIGWDLFIQKKPVSLNNSHKWVRRRKIFERKIGRPSRNLKDIHAVRRLKLKRSFDCGAVQADEQYLKVTK